MVRVDTHGFEIGSCPELPSAVDSVRNARFRDDDRLPHPRMPLDGLHRQSVLQGSPWDACLAFTARQCVGEGTAVRSSCTRLKI